MGSARTTAVVGVYSTAESTEAACVDLINSGFTSSDISILLQDNERTRAFALQKSTKASDAAKAGAAAGGIVGGIAVLPAILGELAIPGIGPMIAGGPMLATLMGVAVGGTLGGLVGTLIGMGIPEFEARLYEGAVKDGDVLLSINCIEVDHVNRARDSLKRTGARDIASASDTIANETSCDDGNHFDGDQLPERASLTLKPS